MNEIALMRLLKANAGTEHIIELKDAEIKRDEQLICMLMELGEIDLAGLLERSGRRGGLNESEVCVYWEQMLQAVSTIHEAHVIHGDLKPANFLLRNGALKLIDFGIAKQSSADTTKIERDSAIGTVNYMSPEAITCTNTGPNEEATFRLGRASDVWALGIILYQVAWPPSPPLFCPPPPPSRLTLAAPVCRWFTGRRPSST